MNQHLEYETILKGQIGASIFALVMIVALFIMLVVLNIKVFPRDLGKNDQIFVNIFVIVVILASSIVFTSHIYNLNQDIKSQSYVEYRGEFHVSEYKEKYVTFKDHEKNITLSGYCDLPGGEYVGTIIYSQSSKHLLDWEINTD